MKNKTKDELIELVEELEEKVKQLENDVDYWQHEYDDMEEERDKLQEQLDDVEEYEGVKNLDNFIHRLKLENLYDDKLEKFIDEYTKFYNDQKEGERMGVGETIFACVLTITLGIIILAYLLVDNKNK